jgi:peptide/nickel transport system permease protein
MLAFVVRRLIGMAITLVLISIISFIIIQLPPGDVVSNYVRQQEAIAGTSLPPETIELLRQRHGFGEPLHVQYLKWVAGFPRGDFGISVVYGEAEVADLIGRRIGLTLFLVFSTLFISWGLAVPLGIYAATHKNQFSDYLFSGVSFIGISVPDFLLAVVYLWITVFVLQSDYAGGLFSPQYQNAPWSLERAIDLAKHLPVPMLILGLGASAGTFRVMRANLLDVLDQQFIETARAKGLAERVVIYKHAVRIPSIR